MSDDKENKELWRLLKLAMSALKEADPIAYQIIANATDVNILKEVFIDGLKHD